VSTRLLYILIAVFVLTGTTAGIAEAQTPDEVRDAAPAPAQSHQADHPPALGEDVEALIAAVEPKVIAWRRDFHEHPELSNREFETAAKVADHLRSLGLEVETEVAHTGVVALLRGGRPGPVVALRADMDGLPVTERVDVPFASRATGIYNGEEVGVMHACGHDTHIAILMGVAEVLTSIREEVPGTVKFIFQPAEEGAPEGEEGGAELMVEEGVLTNPDVDAAFALHISSKGEVGHISYNPRGTYASADDFRITVRGKQTHGAYPWSGVDPIVTSAHIITALQTIVSRQMEVTHNAAVVTIGKIEGGVRSNIIPEEVEMIGTLRALDPDDRLAIHESVRRIATNVAESMGATAEVQIPLSTSYPVTYNDPELTAQMLPVLEAVAGADRVQLTPAQTGAEDFAFFAERVPGFYIRLGGRPGDVAREDASDHHTPDFYVDDSGLGLGVRAMTAMALHYMNTHDPAIGAGSEP
jgi:amidohydrolase